MSRETAASVPPIGGFFALGLLDVPPVPGSIWQAWCADGRPAATARTARAALARLIAVRGPPRVWLPAYNCPQLAEMAPPSAVRYYPLDPQLSPEISFLRDRLLAGDLVFVTDYFGWPPSAEFIGLSAARPDVIWIEDRAHCLHTDAPPWAEWVLYSPRKLVGVAEGGILISKRGEAFPDNSADVADAALALPELMRFEDAAQTRNACWHAAFRAREAQLSAAPAPMSRLTLALLQRIAIAPLIEARRRNYRFLAEQLADYAAWLRPGDGVAPFGFVIEVADAAGLGAALAAERLFCSRHWPQLACDPAEFPAAHALAGRLLTLPCDHRYDEAALARLVEAVRRLAAPG